MKRAVWLSLGALSLLTLTACGGNYAAASGDSSGGSGGGGSGGSSGEGGGGSAGSPGAKWQTLVTGDWQLDSGEELTSDIHTIVLDKDIYVGAIRPIAPQGTHHTVLALGGNGFMGNILYASGVGTNALEFPAGVGLKLKAGDTVVLQLHLFNPTGGPISGTSGIEVIAMAPEDVKEEADIYLPGPLKLNIPPNQVSTQVGNCTVNTEQTLFAVFPHMHQLGSHFKTTLTVGGKEKILHDAEYDFNHQAFIPFDPIKLSPGDSIKTECTWTNTTSTTVGWGESSTTEMCFSILYRYPAQGDQGFCNQ